MLVDVTVVYAMLVDVTVVYAMLVDVTVVYAMLVDVTVSAIHDGGQWSIICCPAPSWLTA